MIYRNKANLEAVTLIEASPKIKKLLNKK